MKSRATVTVGLRQILVSQPSPRNPEEQVTTLLTHRGDSIEFPINGNLSFLELEVASEVREEPESQVIINDDAPLIGEALLD